MSARSQRIEVITRGERRRRWSVEQKREIAAESLEPGISPITVARHYGISSGPLYTWRRHLLEGSLGTSAQPVARFARVDLMAMPPPPAPLTVLSLCVHDSRLITRRHNQHHVYGRAAGQLPTRPVRGT